MLKRIEFVPPKLCIVIQFMCCFLRLFFTFLLMIISYLHNLYSVHMQEWRFETLTFSHHNCINIGPHHTTSKLRIILSKTDKIEVKWRILLKAKKKVSSFAVLKTAFPLQRRKYANKNVKIWIVICVCVLHDEHDCSSNLLGHELIFFGIYHAIKQI